MQRIIDTVKNCSYKVPFDFAQGDSLNLLPCHVKCVIPSVVEERDTE